MSTSDTNLAAWTTVHPAVMLVNGYVHDITRNMDDLNHNRTMARRMKEAGRNVRLFFARSEASIERLAIVEAERAQQAAAAEEGMAIARSREAKARETAKSEYLRQAGFALLDWEDAKGYRREALSHFAPIAW